MVGAVVGTVVDAVVATGTVGTVAVDSGATTSSCLPHPVSRSTASSAAMNFFTVTGKDFNNGDGACFVSSDGRLRGL